MDENNEFYKSVCEKYIDTMSKEMIMESDKKILHIIIDDEYIKLKNEGKININNYKKYLDADFEIENYNNYKEIYKAFVKDNIVYDLNDLELFDYDGNWAFYITFEELKKIGYGFMVKDQFPLIEKYTIPEDKLCEFFDYFTLEQLEDFEQSLNQYFNEKSIVHNQGSYEGFECKEDVNFNRNILKLACGLITYEDFIEDYIVKYSNYYDLSFSKVNEYFKENQIENLMEYGSDSDEGLYHLSSMYQEIINKLGIKYLDIYTEDVSDGKYVTTIIFANNSLIKIDTNAWNGIEVVTNNISTVFENYQELEKKTGKKETIENEEINYDFN